MDIIFSENSGMNDTVYGKLQAPLRMFMEKRAEAFEANSMLPTLFKMGKANSYADVMSTMTAMGDFEPNGENSAYPVTGMQEGYKKLLEYDVEWKNRFMISKMMIEDNKVAEISKRPIQFMTAYKRTRERFGAHIYGAAMAGKKSFKINGHTFDLTGADGANLFSQTHKPKISGGNQSNCFSDAFSVEAMSHAETRMHLFKDDNGNICDVAPDTILIPEDTELKNSVFEAIGSQYKPTDNTNAFNYQTDRWNVIIWPYLNQFINSGEKPWVMLDSIYLQDYDAMVWNDRVELALKSYEDHDNDTNVIQGRSRFNACPFDWRFALAGGMPSGGLITAAS